MKLSSAVLLKAWQALLQGDLNHLGFQGLHKVDCSSIQTQAYLRKNARTWVSSTFKTVPLWGTYSVFKNYQWRETENIINRCVSNKPMVLLCLIPGITRSHSILAGSLSGTGIFPSMKQSTSQLGPDSPDTLAWSASWNPAISVGIIFWGKENTTWKGSMAQLPLVLAYHVPLQIATFWGVASHLLSRWCICIYIL